MLHPERSLSSMADALPHLVWTAEVDGAIDYVSERWPSVTGLRREELLGWGWLRALHPDDTEAIRQGWTQAGVAGTFPAVECRVRMPAGDYRWHRMYAEAGRDDEGKVTRWVGTLTDIHDLKQIAADNQAEREQLVSRAQRAQAEAEAERQRLYDLFMQAPALIAILRGREGVCQLFNPLFSTLWGHRDVIGKPMREAWPELEGQGYFEFVEHVYDKGEPVFGNEYPAQIDRRNDGTLDEVFFNFVYAPYRNALGAVEGIMIHGVEVTDQVLARRRVEESEAYLHTVISTLAEGVIVQSADGSIQTANPSAAQLLGLTAEELAERTSLDPRWRAIHEDGSPLPGEEHPAMVALRSGVPRINTTMGVHKPDGSLVWLLVNSIPLFREHETQPFAVATSFLDITERRQQYQEAQDALTVRDRFISVAAHDLKSPITALVGYVDLLIFRGEKAGTTSERDMKALRTASSEARRLARMVDLLMDFSRMQYGQLSIEHDEVDIAALMRGLVESMLSATDGHVLRHSIPETPVIVVGDELRLQQIAQNLVQNAAKYSEPGSAIDVEVKVQDQQVAIAVADQGIGIAAEEIPHLFDEFYRSSSAGQRKGLGLGLYVVKQLVALHGGTIEVVSEVGRGSTFTVCLPLAIGTGAPDNEVPEQGTT